MASSDENPDQNAPAPDSLEGRVLAAMQAGRKIEAVKIYRAEQDVGLKEAKETVEELARRHGIVATRGGCAGAALLVLILSGALAAALGSSLV